MKNLKNTLTALSLAAVLGLGAVSTNAGILMSDRTASNNNQQLCVNKDETVNMLDGIIITGFSFLDGIIITGREGILMGDKKACESKKDGILMGDRDGILMSD